jgi:hypothetical protein
MAPRKFLRGIIYVFYTLLSVSFLARVVDAAGRVEWFNKMLNDYPAKES